MRGQVKVYTANLKKAMSTMKTELRTQMDNLVRAIFPGTDFAKAYFASRITYNYNAHRTVLRGTETNAIGTPLNNAIVELVDYPSPGEVSKRKTNGAGNYAFKQVSFPAATMRVRAKGYAVAEYAVKIVKNEVTGFDIQLLPDNVRDLVNT